ARGYLGQPGLTAERFVPDVFGGSGGRLYRTGDRARWREDGAIEYLGRLDQQVKIRGHRIEPGEIEAALEKHGGGRQAAVVLREGVLVAYGARGEGGPGVEELRRYLGEHLPAYMIPSRFQLLQELPLTANGKVDRAALPDPDAERPELESAPAAPRDET